MNTPGNAIEVWTNKSQAPVNRDCKEPYAFSETQGRVIALSELAEMTVDQLTSIASEMYISAALVNAEITAEYAVLSKLTCQQPAAMQATRRKILILNHKKASIRRIAAEAAILSKKHRREWHKQNNTPKEKHKQNNKPRERLISSQSQLDLFERIEAKMKFFKNKEWFELLAAEIGTERLRRLELDAANVAVPSLLSWSKENDVPTKYVCKVVRNSGAEFCDSQVIAAMEGPANG